MNPNEPAQPRPDASPGALPQQPTSDSGPSLVTPPQNAWPAAGRVDLPPQPLSRPATPPPATQPVVAGGGFAPSAPASRRPARKLVLMAVGLLVAIGLGAGGFFGFQALAKQQNKNAAAKAADTFAHGLYEHDFDMVKSVYAGDDLTKEDFESEEAQDVFTNMEHVSIEVGRRDGHDRAVAGYKFTIKSEKVDDFKIISGGSDSYYVLIMLQKNSGKWQVENIVPSFVEPKVSLDAYESRESVDDSSTDTGGGTANSQDDEREADIRALHGQVEAYYAERGKYPTLAELNSSSFRKEHMLGLDEDILKDPDGPKAELAAKPAKNVYSYEQSGDTYTLTATKSDGTAYVKRSL